MYKKEWKQCDSAFVIIKKDTLFPNQVVIREAELIHKTTRGLWRIRFDDIADDADIKSVSTTIPERFLFTNLDDALSAAADDFVAELMNEFQNWVDETTEEY